MSNAVFVDTGGFFAIHVAEDRWHTRAAEALKALVGRRVPMLSTSLVLGETYTLLRMRYGATAAWKFVDTLARSPSVEWVHVDAEVDKEAWAILRRYGDQPFSHVDATSFAVMKQRKLKRALAFDAHFAAAGFSRVPVDVAP